jgi:hypothetical protein
MERARELADCVDYAWPRHDKLIADEHVHAVILHGRQRGKRAPRGDVLGDVELLQDVA